MQEDHHVVDRICQLERQRVRGAAPKRMPQLAQAKSAPRDVVRRELVWKRKHAVTDSLTGFNSGPASHPTGRWCIILTLTNKFGTSNLGWKEAAAKYPEGCPPPDPEYSPSLWVFSKLVKYDIEQLRPPVRAFRRWESWATLLILPSVSLARLRCTSLHSSIILPREALRRHGPCGTSAWALTSPSRMQRNTCLAGRNKMSCSRPGQGSGTRQSFRFVAPAAACRGLSQSSSPGGAVAIDFVSSVAACTMKLFHSRRRDNVV